jgi:hypothetical protein
MLAKIVVKVLFRPQGQVKTNNNHQSGSTKTYRILHV